MRVGLDRIAAGETAAMVMTTAGIYDTRNRRFLDKGGECNPEDPNSQGSVCAKGVAGPSMLYDPYRVLSRLGRQMGQTSIPERLLQSVVDLAQDTLRGSARTEVKMSQFGIEVPKLLSLRSEDDVIVKIEFVAVSQPR